MFTLKFMKKNVGLVLWIWSAAIFAELDMKQTEALVAAVRANAMEQVLVLLTDESGQVLANIQDDSKMTALAYAAGAGQLELVEKLLALGADPNLANIAEVSPLMLAATKGYAQVVNRLLAEGVNPNATCNYGTTALIRAARYGHLSVVEILLVKGADPAIRDHFQQTALDYASKFNHLEIVEAIRTALLQPTK